MANTALGRELTEAHRRQQIILRERAEAEATYLLPLLRVDAIDETRALWLGASVAAVTQRNRESTALAATYVPAYRRAEAGTEAGPIVRGLITPVEAAGALAVAGPIEMKRQIAKGVPLTEAERIAFAKVTRTVGQLAMAGGRDTVIRSSGRRRGSRWRRVTDGRPCAFCGMLASRGPTYRSEDTARFRPHGRCGCTVEEVIGAWAPTELELKWDDSYQQAAAAIKAEFGQQFPLNASIVTQRMRRLTPDLFHDGIKPN